MDDDSYLRGVPERNVCMYVFVRVYLLMLGGKSVPSYTLCLNMFVHLCTRKKLVVVDNIHHWCVNHDG